jgi:hypothetical protein
MHCISSSASPDNYTCHSPTCGEDPPSPAVSLCKTSNDCGGESCSQDKLNSKGISKEISKKGFDIGICSKNQPYSNTKSICCNNIENIGEMSTGDTYCCKNSIGVNMKGDKQCEQWLQENQPCCKYALCENGWQCSPTKDDTSSPTNTGKYDPACLSTTFQETKLDDIACCENRYTVNKNTYCCPDKIIQGGECLNITKHKVDPNWFPHVNNNLPSTCTNDTQCQIQEVKDAISNALEGVTWISGGNNKPTATDSLLFCDKTEGVCKLACGYRSNTKGDLDMPFRVVNIEDPQNPVSRCMKPGNLQITTLPKFEYPDSPTIACTYGDDGKLPYWSGNALKKDYPMYQNKITYDINSPHPVDCANALNLKGIAQYSGSTRDGNSYNIPSFDIPISTPSKTSGNTTCTATLDCQHAQSNFTYGQTNIPAPGPLIKWREDGASTSKNFPIDIPDINYRVSMKTPLGGCENIHNSGTNGENCYLPSPGGLSIDPGFKVTQTVSPCYYDPTIVGSSKCIGGDQAHPTDGTTKPIYPENNKIKCNNTPCVPLMLSSGEWCPKGTNNGVKCI